MPETQPGPRQPKAVVGDVKAVAKMLASGVDAVLREYDAGRLPAPLLVCGQAVWRIAEIRQWVAAGCPDRASWERRTVQPRGATAKASAKRWPAQRQCGDFGIPRPGKTVFAWAKRMEKVFETRLVDGMACDGRALGCGDRFAEWSQEQVNGICMRVIAYIRELPTYSGQYEYLFPGGSPDPPWEH